MRALNGVGAWSKRQNCILLHVLDLPTDLTLLTTQLSCSGTSLCSGPKSKCLRLLIGCINLKMVVSAQRPYMSSWKQILLSQEGAKPRSWIQFIMPRSVQVKPWHNRCYRRSSLYRSSRLPSCMSVCHLQRSPDGSQLLTEAMSFGKGRTPCLTEPSAQWSGLIYSSRLLREPSWFPALGPERDHLGMGQGCSQPLESAFQEGQNALSIGCIHLQHRQLSKDISVAHVLTHAKQLRQSFVAVLVTERGFYWFF